MNVILKKATAEGDALHVFGTVDGAPVHGQGWVSRVKDVPKETKLAYVKELLVAASSLAQHELDELKLVVETKWYRKPFVLLRNYWPYITSGFVGAALFELAKLFWFAI